ncbi:hypothetical protein [Paracoccus sediminilitoris]|uniref:hypothetical protein n=1 Tax=Paracoccus sediminilitoris TaxID=2202419 RepID=UPI0011B93B5E|nr:hypothetical protein [Paracoccus sediminilitoris]
MTTEIDAIFVGDSHGMIMQSAAAAHGIKFKYPVTAASATFGGATMRKSENGGVVFEIAASRLDPDRVKPEKISHRLQKANSIRQKLSVAFKTGLPIYSNIGMTARNFVLGIVTAAKANGEDPSLLSKKMMRLAAEEYFQQFVSQYDTMKASSPRVTAVFGPTRFEHSSRALWMSYDDTAARMLRERNIDILDLRGDFGNEDLLLREEFYGQPDDGVHGNDHWGLMTVRKIAEHCQRASSDSPQKNMAY